MIGMTLRERTGLSRRPSVPTGYLVNRQLWNPLLLSDVLQRMFVRRHFPMSTVQQALLDNLGIRVRCCDPIIVNIPASLYIIDKPVQDAIVVAHLRPDGLDGGMYMYSITHQTEPEPYDMYIYRSAIHTIWPEAAPEHLYISSGFPLPLHCSISL